MKPDIAGLEKLAEYMTTVPQDKFDMSEWYEEAPCGAKACILGHASVLFPSRFKRVHIYQDTYSESYKIQHRTAGVEGSLAFAVGFQIDYADASRITLNPRTITPEQAARTIRSLVTRLKRRKA